MLELFNATPCESWWKLIRSEHIVPLTTSVLFSKSWFSAHFDPILGTHYTDAFCMCFCMASVAPKSRGGHSIQKVSCASVVINAIRDLLTFYNDDIKACRCCVSISISEIVCDCRCANMVKNEPGACDLESRKSTPELSVAVGLVKDTVVLPKPNGTCRKMSPIPFTTGGTLSSGEKGSWKS